MLLNTHRNIFSSLCIAVLCISFSALSYAQVSVIKKAGGFRGNPSLSFTGLSGDVGASAAISSDLKSCGWFDLMTGTADYSVSGTASGGKLSISVKDRSGRSFSFAMKYNPSSPRQSAHIAVDTILKTVFSDYKVKGICSSKVAFCVETRRGIKEVYIADFDGKNVTPVTRSNSLSVEPDWVSGKMNLVYTKYGRSSTSIVETDPASRRSRILAQYPGLNSGGAMSPNGRSLALTLSLGGQVDLYVKTFGRNGQMKLTSGSSVEASPCWSPDGRQVCFVSDMAGRPKLFMVKAGGGGLRPVPSTGSEAVSPDWNSANKIVYSAKTGSTYKIAVTDLSTGQSTVVANGGGDWESPSWAPDNRHIICSRTVNGKASLYIIDSWSGKSREFARAAGDLTLPSWSNLY